MKLLLGALVLLALVAGCGDTHRASGPYSQDDVHWLGRFATWQSAYWKRLDPVHDTYLEVLEGQAGLDALRTATAPARECGETLRSQVRAPDDERLGRAYDLLVKFCDAERRWGTALVAGALTPTEQERATGSNAALASQRLLDSALRTIDAGLRANRALPVRGGSARESRIEPRLSRAASVLALKKVEVRCWSQPEWKLMVREWDTYAGVRRDVAGFVNGTSRVNIAPDYCARLARFYAGWRPPSGGQLDDAADAVDLLAHEAQHLFNPNGNEAETECHGLQDVRRLAVLLGASREYGEKLAQDDWKYLYEYNDSNYKTKECRPNGLFDMHPETPGFPD